MAPCVPLIDSQQNKPAGSWIRISLYLPNLAVLGRKSPHSPEMRAVLVMCVSDWTHRGWHHIGLVLDPDLRWESKAKPTAKWRCRYAPGLPWPNSIRRVDQTHTPAPLVQGPADIAARTATVSMPPPEHMKSNLASSPIQEMPLHQTPPNCTHVGPEMRETRLVCHGESCHD